MTIPGHHLVTVYEAYNETLREVYLGATGLLLPRLIADFQRRPPRLIADSWLPAHVVQVRALLYSVPADQATRVIEKLARANVARGRVIFDSSGKPISVNAP